mmetsp:Transcript_10482/g.32535  ORF Transcript_10482/g.32535 Transcript_10482/m.32535 type:complete len:86 (-) Transcript_10482:113-370(-)
MSRGRQRGLQVPRTSSHCETLSQPESAEDAAAIGAACDATVPGDKTFAVVAVVDRSASDSYRAASFSSFTSQAAAAGPGLLQSPQ